MSSSNKSREDAEICYHQKGSNVVALLDQLINFAQSHQRFSVKEHSSSDSNKNQTQFVSYIEFILMTLVSIRDDHPEIFNPYLNRVLRGIVTGVYSPFDDASEDNLTPIKMDVSMLCDQLLISVLMKFQKDTAIIAVWLQYLTEAFTTLSHEAAHKITDTDFEPMDQYQYRKSRSIGDTGQVFLVTFVMSLFGNTIKAGDVTSPIVSHIIELSMSLITMYYHIPTIVDAIGEGLISHMFKNVEVQRLLRKCLLRPIYDNVPSTANSANSNTTDKKKRKKDRNTIKKPMTRWRLWCGIWRKYLLSYSNITHHFTAAIHMVLSASVDNTDTASNSDIWNDFVLDPNGLCSIFLINTIQMYDDLKSGKHMHILTEEGQKLEFSIPCGDLFSKFFDVITTVALLDENMQLSVVFPMDKLCNWIECNLTLDHHKYDVKVIPTYCKMIHTLIDKGYDDLVESFTSSTLCCQLLIDFVNRLNKFESKIADGDFTSLMKLINVLIDDTNASNVFQDIRDKLCIAIGTLFVKITKNYNTILLPFNVSILDVLIKFVTINKNFNTIDGDLLTMWKTVISRLLFSLPPCLHVPMFLAKQSGLNENVILKPYELLDVLLQCYQLQQIVCSDTDNHLNEFLETCMNMLAACYNNDVILRISTNPNISTSYIQHRKSIACEIIHLICKLFTKCSKHHSNFIDRLSSPSATVIVASINLDSDTNGGTKTDTFNRYEFFVALLRVYFDNNDVILSLLTLISHIVSYSFPFASRKHKQSGLPIISQRPISHQYYLDVQGFSELFIEIYNKHVNSNNCMYILSILYVIILLPEGFSVDYVQSVCNKLIECIHHMITMDSSEGLGDSGKVCQVIANVYTWKIETSINILIETNGFIDSLFDIIVYCNNSRKDITILQWLSKLYIECYNNASTLPACHTLFQQLTTRGFEDELLKCLDDILQQVENDNNIKITKNKANKVKSILISFKQRAGYAATDETEPADAIPNEFLCPITAQLMRDPVMLLDGHTYERDAITRWLNQHKRSPKTNQSLNSKTMIPNHALKALIENFVESKQKTKKTKLDV